MLNGDEHAWNEQLAKRINQYRKRPSDYQPVVDFVSISLIKMAQRKHKIPKSSSFYTVFFQKFEVDQHFQIKYL